MADLIIVAIVAVIIGLAARYIYKAKKSGAKCIGCPSGGCCSGSAGEGCGCGCGGSAGSEKSGCSCCH